MAKKETNDVAKKVGSGLAHVQSFVDDVFQTLFVSLRKTAKQKQKTLPQDAKVSEKAVYGLKKAAGFLGEVGDIYYQKYEEIKAKKVQKPRKKSDSAK